MSKAIPALRAGLGLSLVFVALTEKFANIPLASAFLELYPLNFTAALGIPVSNETFILCVGVVELLVGLWILRGVLITVEPEIVHEVRALPEVSVLLIKFKKD